MIEANVCIYVFTRNKTNLLYEILSVSEDVITPPSAAISTNEDMELNIKKLFSKFFNDVVCDMYQFTTLDIDNYENKLMLSYFCIVPFGVTNTSGYFIPLNKTNNENIIKNIRKVFNIA
jgi:hypothetical protein